MPRVGLAYTFLRLFGSLSLLTTISSFQANGETIRVSSGFVQQNSTPDFNGSFVMTFDATGLPAGDPASPQEDGPSVPVSNLNVTVSFDNGTMDTAINGTGTITARYAGFSTNILDYLSFSAGDIQGYFAMVDKYNGNGGILLDDGENSSLIEAADVTGYLNSPSSLVVAPEPSSFWLAAGAALALAARFRGKRSVI